MLDIAAAGSEEFIIGFQLAGIRKTFVIDTSKEGPFGQLKRIMANAEIGIIITEEKIMQMLDEHDRNMIEDSVKPVVIVISEEASSESLRRMIRKSIGIDLWAQE